MDLGTKREARSFIIVVVAIELENRVHPLAQDTCWECTIAREVIHHPAG